MTPYLERVSTRVTRGESVRVSQEESQYACHKKRVSTRVTALGPLTANRRFGLGAWVKGNGHVGEGEWSRG